jgi:glycosyltransferase involved in cell wall biosynthesis
MSNIFIDLTSLCRKLTGIENYAYNLVYNMIQTDVENRYILMFRKFINMEFNALRRGNDEVALSPFRSQLLTEQIFIPFYLRKVRPDLAFFPAFPPGFFVYCPAAFIMYDVAMWKYANCLSLKNKLYFKPLSELAAKRARCVLTISESSKKELVQVFPFLSGKVTNIAAGLPKFDIDKSYNHALKQLPKTNYLLMVGSVEPRKNMPFAVESIAELLHEKKLFLYIVGRVAWGSQRLSDLIRQKSLQQHVKILGYVAKDELSVLYSNAVALIFPSLHEGFGFPILEAFKHNCPVITSNISSMPEVAGDAAIFINPYDGESLRAAVSELLDNENLRASLQEKGRQQLKIFSWEKSAQLALNAFRMNVFKQKT